jgi:Flp pilus assembly protein protease CpaA
MILNIVCITLLGIITTYTDLKKRLIENRVILAGLLAAPLLHLYTILQNPALTALLPYMFYNMAFSIFAGVLLWYINMWPAGDAKLFIAYSFLLPIEIYQITQYFISFDFLINTFVPIFMVMLFFLLLRSKKSDMKNSIKFALNSYTVLLSIIVIVGFLWFFFEFLSLLGFGLAQNYLISMVVLFLIIEIFTKIAPFNLEYLYLFLALVRLFLDYRNVLTLNYMYYMFTLLFSFLIVRFFVIDLGFKGYTIKKRVEDLEPGMCLAEGIREKKIGDNVEYEKERLAPFEITQALKDRTKNFIHNTSFDGLTKEDVKKIKKLREEGKINFSDILIHTITPFALFLFLGILMTVLLKTNFVTYIRDLLLY